MKHIFVVCCFIVIGFIVGFIIVTILGCGGGADEPVVLPADDLMYKEKLVGAWDVVSVNDIEPSRFLTLILVKDIDDGDIEPETTVPAAPRGGEFVIIEDELQEVYDTKADVREFHYTFEKDDTWTLHVQFDVLPNDEAPVDGGAASDPGGDGQGEQIDPNKPAAPAANGTNEAIATGIYTWSGTYQVESDLLTLTTENKKFDYGIYTWLGTLQAQDGSYLKEKMTERFQLGLINPFSKTYMSIDDAGRLILTMPGNTGKIILEKR